MTSKVLEVRVKDLSKGINPWTCNAIETLASHVFLIKVEAYVFLKVYPLLFKYLTNIRFDDIIKYGCWSLKI
jgi:hypothetical protein